MQLEDFFIQKYQELEQRCKELEEAAEQQSTNTGRYGIFFESCEKSIVKVTVQSYYSLFESTWGGVWKKKSIEQLENMNMAPTALEKAGVITVHREAVLGVLTKRDLDDETTIYVTPSLGTVSVLDEADGHVLDEWFPASVVDDLAAVAIECIKEYITRRIEELQKAQKEEGGTDE